MKKNKIAVICPMWQRPELTNIVFSYYHQLQKLLQKEIDIVLCAVGSEGEISQNIAEKNNWNYIECQNFPLNKKMNSVLKFAKKFNPNAVVIIGSDDFLNKNTFYFYNKLINNKINSFGFLDAYVLDEIQNELIYWGGYAKGKHAEGISTGLGRFYSYKILELLKWNLWGDVPKNRSLDAASCEILNKYKIFPDTCKLYTIDAFILDIKGLFNLTNVSNLKNYSTAKLIETKESIALLKKHIGPRYFKKLKEYIENEKTIENFKPKLKFQKAEKDIMVISKPKSQTDYKIENNNAENDVKNTEIKELVPKLNFKTANIIVRANNNLQMLKHVVNSIQSQKVIDYKINIIIVTDNDEISDYAKNNDLFCKKLNEAKKQGITQKFDKLNCTHSPKNLYFNVALNNIKDAGIVLFLDNNTIFDSINSLQLIISYFKNPDAVVYYKINDNNKIAPTEPFKNKIELGRITGVSFAFSTNLIKHAQWDEYNGSSYRVASNILKNATTKLFSNSVFIKTIKQDEYIEILPLPKVEKSITEKPKPLFNILVRTSNRPKYFKKCIESIQNQTYKNFKIIVSADNQETLDYVKKYKNIEIVDCTPKDYELLDRKKLHLSFEFEDKIAQFAPYNLYLNRLMDKVSKGFIIYCDDDDRFTTNKALATIAKQISSDNDLIMWRAKFPFGKTIPVQEYTQNYTPQCCNIGGGCIAFHSKYIPKAQWDEFTMGDYRVIKKLHKIIPTKKYINDTLIGLQRTTGMGGHGIKDDGKEKGSNNLKKELSKLKQINLLHSGNIGDIIYSLPAIKSIYNLNKAKINFYLNYNVADQKEIEAKMSKDFAESLKSLLEVQPYINKVECVDGKHNVDISYNLDNFRELFKQGQRNLLFAHLDLFEFSHKILQTQCMDLNIEKKYYKAKVVVNRTARYHTDKLDYNATLKKYNNDAVFIGSMPEYIEFCNQWKVKIPYYKTKNLYEVAQVIANSQIFIGNGSMCMAIAVVLNHPAICEMHPVFTACNIDRSNLTLV